MTSIDPKIVINFKTYTQGLGTHAMTLARIAEKISREYNVYIAVAPQLTDLRFVALSVDLPVFAQHVDAYKPGGYTGHVLPEAVKNAGATGTLLNHSERQLNLKVVKTTIQRCREANLTSIVCGDTPAKIVEITTFQPDIVAIEPPDLIGTGIPVSKARPEIVEKTVSLVREQNTEIPILCGAGITKGDDVAAALSLGTQGVILASSVVKAHDPEKALIDLVLGTKGS